MDEEFIKDFDGWIGLKKNMDTLAKVPTVNEGEVWWCGVGANVGVEISGKGKRHSRPARVISVSRLYNKMGQVPKSDLDKIKLGFRELYE